MQSVRRRIIYPIPFWVKGKVNNIKTKTEVMACQSGRLCNVLPRFAYTSWLTWCKFILNVINHYFYYVDTTILIYFKLIPVLKDPYYLETQHLLIAVKGEDEQESYGKRSIFSYFLQLFNWNLVLLCISFFIDLYFEFVRKVQMDGRK